MVMEAVASGTLQCNGLQHRQIAGNPLEPNLPKVHGNVFLAKRKLGYGNNDFGLGNPQPIPKEFI